MKLKKWLIMGLLLGAAALTGSLWAGQLSTSIDVTAANPAADGQIATVSSVATTPIVVTTPKKNGGRGGGTVAGSGRSEEEREEEEEEAIVRKILNVTLHRITNIAPGHENDMSFRFYIINPQEMDQILGSNKAILQLKVTDFSTRASYSPTAPPGHGML